ncbi:hydroxyisourate hydrolase [Streptomyces niveiscabiei]|uniref:hydroxyisourate hydrolase n=1 Tax=Streptomyces niveiscabiei TaxID=164115 RepID=UPI0029A8869B|nr:hydroxyisourate hydrolase [Streptomyces niveiscabiei]MDX3380755.1 hydroxyisourate hydrolase [Streptomyces niveiscabiei]
MTSTVSTHILDTSAGRPATGVTVRLAVSAEGDWRPVGESVTDADGRCADFPPLPEGTAHARLVFEVDAEFFPEVTVAFAVGPGEHYHVPLLLNPFGYSVYRGS